MLSLGILESSAFTYPGAGTISYVGATSHHFVTTPSSISLTSLTGGSDAAALPDDLVTISYMTADVTTTPDDPTITTSGYDPLISLLSATDINRGKLRAWSKRMGATADTSITVPALSSDQAGSIVVKVYRGVHSDIQDVAATTATGTDSSIADPPSITPSTAGARIIAIGAGAGNATFTAISGMTDAVVATEGITAGHAGASLIVADKSDWTSGAYDPAAVTGGSSVGNDCWLAATIVLKPTNIVTPPVFTVIPTITSANGFYSIGDTLTGVPGTHNGIDTGYQWKRDGVAIGGETGTSYTLAAADEGKYITFNHSAINYLGSTTSPSLSTGPVAYPTYQTDSLIPAGDMQGGSDTFLPAGDMQSGSDNLLWVERLT